MNDALKMNLKGLKIPHVPGAPDPASMKEMNYSSGISEQFNSILEKRSQLINYPVNQQFQIPTPQTPPVQYPQAPIPEAVPKSEVPGMDLVQQYLQQSVAPTVGTPVQVIKRSLTIAEVGVLFLAAVLTVGGLQSLWNIVPKPVIQVEWRR